MRAVLCLAAALIKGSALGGYPGLECVAYVPAAAVIILAASLIRGWPSGISGSLSAWLTSLQLW